MQIILDNIASTFIAGAVLLVFLSTNHQAQVTAVESASYYMLQRHVTDFTRVVQRDMQNLSSVVNVSGTNTSFSFYAQVSEVDTVARLVEYRRTPAYALETATDTTQLYQILRFVDGNVAGGSLSSIHEWIVEPRDDTGNIATNPSDVTSLFVSIGAIPPTKSERHSLDTLPEAEWETVFRPRLLRPKRI